jgi:hypothetical protein
LTPLRLLREGFAHRIKQGLCESDCTHHRKAETLSPR